MKVPRAARSMRLLGVVVLGSVAVAAAAGPAELPPQVPEAARARVRSVTTNPSLAVRVDAPPFTARREIFEYLLDHPDFATHVTRSLKLARYRIWKTPGGLAIDDGWGTTGTFELVWAGEGARLMYARGVYDHKILPDIRGQAAVLIDYTTQPAPAGRSVITSAVTGFVKLDSRVLAFAAKLATSVATAKGEKEAQRLVKLFARTTAAIEADPGGVYEKVRQSPDVPARELEEFRRLLNLSSAGAG